MEEKINKIIKEINTPQKIQDLLETIPFNHEKNGETCRSAFSVIKHNKAHCLEGAFLASYLLFLLGYKPYILSLKVKTNDFEHVITIFKENNYWGALSKTNHSVLGYRDPVYKSVRELAMSYFNEYFLVKNGEKTLIGYSYPINLNRYGNSWITSDKNLFDIGIKISKSKHRNIIPKVNEKIIRKANKLERKVASISWEEINNTV